ncbi:Ubiquitin thioesterase Zranb1 [Mactra antiquata]
MSEDVKWDCPTCTYKNFPASRKCSLCLTSRPVHLISDLVNAEQDIYKVAELEQRNYEVTEKTVNKPLVSPTSSHEWACQHCTYINKFTDTKCTQCRIPVTQKVVTPVDFIPDGKSPLSLPQPSSSQSNTKSSGHKEIGKQDIGKRLASLWKWACKVCTYENFPTINKCVMCRTPKERYFGEICDNNRHNLNDLKLEIDVDSKNQENSRSAQSSPGQASACYPSSVKSGQNSPQALDNVHSSFNNKGSNGSLNNRSGHTSPNCSVGNMSPNNRSSPSLTQRNSNHGTIAVIPYTEADINSIQNLHSGQNSPQDAGSGQTSPSCVVRGSPIVARSTKSNRNQSGRHRQDALYIEDAVGAIGGYREDETCEKIIQKLRKKLSTEDITWLNACESVVSGDPSGIERYLTSGGDPVRQLTKKEILILDRPSAYEVGHTLVHLALRFRRDDMVAILLAATDITTKGFKRLPSYTCPDLSSAIRREVSVALRQGSGSFSCWFLTDFCTFTLPSDIEDLPGHVQTQLFNEILDTDVDKELTDEFVINWSVELSDNLRSKLYPMWNRSSGDCLLDSVLQATWGILDIDNNLRRALADSLSSAAKSFSPKWMEYEMAQANLLNFSLEKEQWDRDWQLLLSLANQPGASLEQMHIFTLAHILRRPIIVYGVKVVKSFRGETIDFARFEGVYLPLLWERSFCSKIPIALGYTRGHFSALVPMDAGTGIPLGAGAHIDNAVDEQIFYLPLVDHEGAFLPLHFTSTNEIGQEETILRRWLECYVTQEGHFVAMQKVGKPPALVGQMIEMWLDYYRHDNQSSTGQQSSNDIQYYSEEESDLGE